MTSTVTLDWAWLKAEFARAFRRNLLAFSLPYVVIWYLLTLRPRLAWAYVKAAIED